MRVVYGTESDKDLFHNSLLKTWEKPMAMPVMNLKLGDAHSVLVTSV